jgi:hypothetical protein
MEGIKNNAHIRNNMPIRGDIAKESHPNAIKIKK